jgi:hypothetical protein
MVADLIQWAYDEGYEITLGDAYRDPRLHGDVGLGLKWESMGGSWGGRFNDGNHYSLEHEGRR